MASEQHTTPLGPAATRAGAPGSRPGRRVPRIGAETVGHVLVAVGLAAFLWTRIDDVDGYYLDEWIYVHGAEYIWEHLPGGLIQSIPLWDRGPQRLYSTLMAPQWGLLSANAAYTVSHVVNVLLLSSAIAPAALLARRVIASPALRVLAAALAVAIPWLTIGSHLLTESLAFPLFLWVLYAIVVAAERPSLRTQVTVLAAILALALCRLNLAAIFVALPVAALAAEIHGRGDGGRWVRDALRRHALVLAATAVAAAAILFVLAASASSLGRYGIHDLGYLKDKLVGPGATETRHVALTYTRALILGGFVLPFTLGLGAALAGIAGRLGPRLVVPSAVAIAAFVSVVGVAALATAGGVLEERYAFYAYPAIAVLAVAALEHVGRLRPWVLGAGAFCLWAVIVGYAAPAANSGHFFAFPAGAFWSRVLDHRLRAWEQDVFGWTLIAPTGWLLIGTGLAAVVAWLTLARRRPHVVSMGLALALAVCLVAQVTNLGYSFKQELYGTTDAPGGIALGPGRGLDRETWLDDAVPGSGPAAAAPLLITPGMPYGGVDRITFWNKDIDTVVDMGWNGSPVPAPPGVGVIPTVPDGSGLARWHVPPPRWLAAQPDDPRVQFAGRVVARAPASAYALLEVDKAEHALWTARDLDADGSVLIGRPAILTLNRELAKDADRVVVRVRAPDGAPVPVTWRIALGGKRVETGRLAAGRDAAVALPIPACASAQCDPIAWTLSARGEAVGKPMPFYGLPGDARPVVLQLTSVKVGG